MICAKCKKETNKLHAIEYSYQGLCDQCQMEMDRCRKCSHEHDREVSDMYVEIKRLKALIPISGTCELEGCE